MCDLLGGEFVPNSETIASNYFALDALPELSKEKNRLNKSPSALKPMNTLKSNKFGKPNLTK